MVAGADHRQIVRVACQVLEQVRDFDARLASLLERASGGHQLCFRSPDELQAQISLLQKARRQRLPIEAVQGGLGIEGVHLTRTALQEDEDHTFGFRGKMRRLGRQGIGGDRQISGSIGRLLAEQIAQRQRTETETSVR